MSASVAESASGSSVSTFQPPSAESKSEVVSPDVASPSSEFKELFKECMSEVVMMAGRCGEASSENPEVAPRVWRKYVRDRGELLRSIRTRARSRDLPSEVPKEAALSVSFVFDHTERGEFKETMDSVLSELLSNVPVEDPSRLPSVLLEICSAPKCQRDLMTSIRTFSKNLLKPSPMVSRKDLMQEIRDSRGCLVRSGKDEDEVVEAAEVEETEGELNSDEESGEDAIEVEVGTEGDDVAGILEIDEIVVNPLGETVEFVELVEPEAEFVAPIVREHKHKKHHWCVIL